MRTPLADAEERCPNKKNHRLGPINYVDHVEWAEAMLKTHDNLMCDGCKLFVIWKKRDEAVTDADLCP